MEKNKVMKKSFIVLFVLLSLTAFSQKKVLNHNVYDIWNKVSNVDISNDGKYSLYIKNKIGNRGDGNLIINSLKNNFSDTINRAYTSKFTYNSKFIISKIKGHYDIIYKKKLKKKRDFPMDSLKIYSLDSNKVIYWDNFITRYSIPKESSDIVVYERFKRKISFKDVYENVPDSLFIGVKNSKYLGFKKYYKKEIRKKDKDKEIVILDLKTLKSYTIDKVKSYFLSKKGNNVYFITSKKKNKKDKVAKEGISYFNYKTKKIEILDSVGNFYNTLGVNEQGDRIGFIYSKDSLKIKEKNKKYNLGYIYFDKKGRVKRRNIDDKNKGIPKNWEISSYSNIWFSEKGNRLFFKTRPVPEKIEKDTTRISSEKPMLDIWSWDDKQIQPQQKTNYTKLLKKGYTTMYVIGKKNIIQLEREGSEGFIAKTGDENYFYTWRYVDNIKNTWKYPFNAKYYSINAKTGRKKLVLNNQVYGMLKSNSGNYFTFFNQETKKWNIYNTKNNKIINASKNIKENLFDEDFNNPSDIPPYKILGWSKNEKSVYIKDKYDIWKLYVNGKEAENITKGYGRKNNIQLDWINVEKKDFKGFENNIKEMFFIGFNEKTKDKGIYKFNFINGNMKEILGEKSNNYSFLKKAKNSKEFLFRKQNFTKYPDIYVSNLEDIKNEKKLSDINPQQKDYKWGTVELTKWKSYSGRELEGLIYKPEDFDPNKKYPMIVYFYETYAKNKNSYYSPVPLWSIINFEYCTSNGYVVFVPDIKYKKGQPGEDAYDCIISGTEMMEKTGYIDTNKMALQGQSWGGYQTAYLITRTKKKFTCAMAGAPVSNMTSAYGGIRWKSGVNRAFQYENGQSRLGTTMWENRDIYIKNSPVFFADKVETPLLMMHNDGDGAVPWYQGIEYYIALRRFKKPVWMLTYNRDGHNLRKWGNRVDLSIRMMQFFDYYLKDAPKPKWLKYGVNQLQKNQEYYGYELEK